MSSIDIESSLRLQNSNDDHDELDFEEEIDESHDIKNDQFEEMIEGDNNECSDVDDGKANEDGEASDLSDEGEIADSNSDGELFSDTNCNEDSLPIKGFQGYVNKRLNGPVCKFFLRGSCSWGNTCRYIHSANRINDSYPIIRNPPNLIPPSFDYLPKPESAWERGMKQAKEMVKSATARKKAEPDFKEKKLTINVEEGQQMYNDNYYDQIPSEFTRQRMRSPPTPEPYAAPSNFQPSIQQRKSIGRRGDEWTDPWVRRRSPKRRSKRSYTSYSSSTTSRGSSSRSSSSTSNCSQIRKHRVSKFSKQSQSSRYAVADNSHQGSRSTKNSVNRRSSYNQRQGGKMPNEKRTISISKNPSTSIPIENAKSKKSTLHANRRSKSSSSSSSSSSDSSISNASPDKTKNLKKINFLDNGKSKLEEICVPKLTPQIKSLSALSKPSIKMTLNSNKTVDRMNAVKRRSDIEARLNDDSDSGSGEPIAKRQAASLVKDIKIKDEKLQIDNPKIKVEKIVEDKKNSSRREELLKQLKKVEDAIKRKKSKLN